MAEIFIGVFLGLWCTMWAVIALVDEWRVP